MLYYRNTATQQVYGYNPETQQELIDKALALGWTAVPVWPMPPSEEELMAECKKTAAALLYQTDWTAMPDVANPQNNPYLTNQADFIAYRNEIRSLAVTPVPNPTWPSVPAAQWSSD